LGVDTPRKIKASVKSILDSDTKTIISNPLTINERPHLRASSMSLTLALVMFRIYRSSSCFCIRYLPYGVTRIVNRSSTLLPIRQHPKNLIRQSTHDHNDLHQLSSNELKKEHPSHHERLYYSDFAGFKIYAFILVYVLLAVNYRP